MLVIHFACLRSPSILRCSSFLAGLVYALPLLLPHIPSVAFLSSFRNTRSTMTLDTCFTPMAPQFKATGTSIGFHLWDTKKEQVLPQILRSILNCSKTELCDILLARNATYLVQEEFNRVNTAQAKAVQADKTAGLAFRHQKSFLTTLLKDVSIHLLFLASYSFPHPNLLLHNASNLETLKLLRMGALWALHYVSRCLEIPSLRRSTSLQRNMPYG